MNRTPGAGLYARVSTGDQDVGLQLDELRQTAVLKGLSVEDEYVDEGVSGAQATRPGLDRLMGDARSGKLDVVLVWRFDRFARSTHHLLSALEEFRQLGVDFVSLREGIDTATPMGKVVFTVIAAISEFERELIRERVIAGVRRAQAAGKHCGRPRRHLDLRAVDALREQGRSLHEVSRILGVPRSTIQRRLREQAEGVPKTPSGGSMESTNA